jgi:hypothetical protein
MEGVLVILERLVLLAVAIFAIYQSFEVEDRGWLARPAAGWTVRLSLIGLAGVCLFTVARLVGTR